MRKKENMFQNLPLKRLQSKKSRIIFKSNLILEIFRIHELNAFKNKLKFLNPIL